jgi:O-phospho-L-seryl-tRNASec:L-selenocysteinyl-tRNA synthase
MNEANFALAAEIIPETYIKIASQARKQRENIIKNLLSHRALPEDGIDDETIEVLLSELAMMDSNNFVENVGVGEREGRVYSSLVAKRHYRLAHGIGRSGDIAEVQPKAAGSSLMYQLTNYLALDAVHIAGITRASKALVVPLATGMTLALALRSLVKKNSQAKYVLWIRIDQKACLKSITAAGFTPIVIENKLNGDEIQTDVDLLRETIVKTGFENILAVMSTTSCFAPRAFDNVIEISKLCKEFNLHHVINNAYGLQDTKITHNINEAMRLGTVSAVIQSTDKNFMVPVGGAVVISQYNEVIDQISKTYAGRASASPITDLFITLLSMGTKTWKKLITERKQLYDYTKSKLSEFADKIGEKVIHTPGNTISLAMTVDKIAHQDPTYLGSMLFARCSSGLRIVTPKSTRQVADISFTSYGAHFDNYPHTYLTVAAAIGGSKEEIDKFFVRFEKTFKDYQKEIVKKAKKLQDKTNNIDTAPTTTDPK